MTDERNPQTTPPTKPGIGAPSRQEFGDKIEKATRRMEPARTEDEDTQDAGEGHKGPRVDATRPGRNAPRTRRG